MIRYQKKATPVEVYELHYDLSGGEVPKWVTKAFMNGTLMHDHQNSKTFLLNKNRHSYGKILVRDKDGEIQAITRQDLIRDYEKVEE